MKAVSVKELLRIFAFPLAVFAIHVLVLVPLNIYDLYTWFDILMHLLGGFAVGVSYSLILRRGFFGPLKKIQIFLIMISFVALTAVLWEFWEFSVDLAFGQAWQRGLADTMADLFFGLIGGIFASIIGRGRTHKSL